MPRRHPRQYKPARNNFTTAAQITAINIMKQANNKVSLVTAHQSNIT